ncbi:MAG: hypothetical protein QXX30_03610 [Candidatus Aenigmatarchaeota archaeon]
MKGAIPVIILVILMVVGLTIGIFSFISNQKRIIVVNLKVLYESNEAYREIVSILNLDRVYNEIALSDYYQIPEDRREFLIRKINISLFSPKCFKIFKDSRSIIEYPMGCNENSYNAVVPMFVPGRKVEKLYFSYER